MEIIITILFALFAILFIAISTAFWSIWKAQQKINQRLNRLIDILAENSVIFKVETQLCGCVDLKKLCHSTTRIMDYLNVEEKQIKERTILVKKPVKSKK